MAKKSEKTWILDGDDWFNPPVDTKEYFKNLETEVEDPEWYGFYPEICRSILKEAIQDGKSAISSPFSFYILMSVLLNATAKKGQKEIKDAIYPKGSYIKNITNTFSSLQRDFTWQMKGGKLISSNAVFIKNEKGLEIKDSFAELVRKSFNGELFSENGEILQKVNDWVNKKTEGMIPELLTKEPEAAVIMNALAFKVKWAVPYDPYAIEEECFCTFEEDEEDCTMLYSEEKMYVEDEFCKGFIKDYKGDRFAFMGLLPKEEGKDAFDKMVDNVDFLALFKNKKEVEVDVSIPEFEFDTSLELKEYCESLGIKTVFTDRADLSPMAEGYPLKIDSILQKAYISVDRNGTKAAAVTGAVCVAGAVPDFEKPSVYLDRPFIYAIINRHSGLPVFVGAVTTLIQ